MNDLIEYIIALFKADADMIAICVDAGAVGVSVVSPEQRTKAAYPRIIVYGDTGRQDPTGDVAPVFFASTLWIEAVARASDPTTPPSNANNPLAIVRALEARISELILGNRNLGLQGLQGTQFSDAWRCDSCFQRSAGLLPKGAGNEPTIERWGASYGLKLRNLSA